MKHGRINALWEQLKEDNPRMGWEIGRVYKDHGIRWPACWRRAASLSKA